MAQPVITVVGSINMDMVTAANLVPDQGETVIGKSFTMGPGGKGANQAVAAARLGAKVQLIGKVGQDDYGSALIDHMKAEGISEHTIAKTATTHTGIANVIVSDQDNRIIIVPGANDEVTPDYLKEFKQTIIDSDLILMQFEIPVETILYCLDLCEENDIPVIVNPAPARKIPDKYWDKVTYVTPNEGEAAQLFGTYDQRDPLSEKLIITKGEHGVSFQVDQQEITIPAYTVEPVDTTGAGDTFNGALSVALAEKMDLKSAIKFANAASALSIQKFGAQTGMPIRASVDAFLVRDI